MALTTDWDYNDLLLWNTSFPSTSTPELQPTSAYTASPTPDAATPPVLPDTMDGVCSSSGIFEPLLDLSFCLQGDDIDKKFVPDLFSSPLDLKSFPNESSQDISFAPETYATAGSPQSWIPSTDASTTYPKIDPAFMQGYLQLSTSHIQLLAARVQVLETSLKESEGKIEEFASWSKNMEKHYQETSTTVLSLFKIIQKPEFLRTVLQDLPEDV